MTASVAITAILAAGQTIVILTRNIDLSVGSIVGVTAYVTGEYLHDHPNLTPLLAVAYAMAIGGGLGLLNGVLVAYARVPSIIVTLGTLAIFRTWLINHSDSRTITSDGLPDWLLSLLSLSVTATPYFQTLYSLSLALGRPEVIFRLNLYDLAIRVPAVVIGFLQWGAVGMAAGRLVAATMMALFFLRWLRSLLAIGIAEQLAILWKIAVAAAVMTAGVLGLRSAIAAWHMPALAELFAVAALGALLYGLGLLACGLRLALGAGRLDLSDRWWRPRIGTSETREGW